MNVTSAANTMRVTDITLSGKASGNRATITGDVTVKDNHGQAIPNANVAIRWTLPGGATQTATALTGVQRPCPLHRVWGAWHVHPDGHGCYQEPGYVFDATEACCRRALRSNAALPKTLNRPSRHFGTGGGNSCSFSVPGMTSARFSKLHHVMYNVMYTLKFFQTGKEHAVAQIIRKQIYLERTQQYLLAQTRKDTQGSARPR